ncbi:MAG TPA: FxLYD domain-containing protein [Verrucomicrobiae bacterium]|nr:FxLYD domain-containing protein [Verrucomicrobiae bacterium]
MAGTKYLKGECSQCGGRLEFPAENAGMTVDCPHCGKPTELFLSQPDIPESGIPFRRVVWASVAFIILAGGLGGALYGLHLAKKRLAPVSVPVATTGQTASAPVAAAGPAARAGFGASAITLQKTPGSSLVYATGTLTNLESRQRFGVRVEIDLLGNADQKLGQATDYSSVIETNGTWDFKALIVEPAKVKRASLASVSEEK